MFGYIRPLIPELKVKDKELYQAYYCGLCRALKNYGLGGRASLTYDATFAAMLLTGVTQESAPGTALHGCPLHPARGKIPMAEPTEVMDFCAALCVLLAKYKLKDDARDGRPMRKCLLPALARGCKRAARRYPELESTLSSGLERLAVIEQERPADPDAAPLLFGGVLADLICGCPGLPEDKRPVMEELCRAVGGFIYALDAWDDRADDAKRGCYNLFNTTEANGLKPWPDGKYRELGIDTAGSADCLDAEAPDVKGSDVKQMAEAMLDMYINSACLAYDLLDAKHCAPVLDNIVHMGLGAAADEVLNKKDDKEDAK